MHCALVAIFALLAVYAQAQNCNGKLSAAVRKTIVDLHNKYRSEVARGIATMKGGKKTPQASNMNKLVYDCQLERETQAWVDKCQKAHSPNSRNASENLYFAWGGSNTQETHLPRAIASWYSEISKYDASDPQNALTMNMIWAESTLVGCGFSNTCPDNMVYVACRYRKMGNYLNRSIYKKGAPCRKCESGRGCSAYEGLCVA
ncbi:unnamed protein product [Enterobius vermicularis]|uniref:SCP domain-containing protein n=1 Tax=Enterobius vermicularis TaxID=51028 RepID=A0A0N4VC53_ENTVE|nr:unnamed protein product [Enterobius vermicularis]